MQNWLCLPLNKTLNLQGSWVSNILDLVKIEITKCQNSSDFTKPCAPQDQIDSFFDDSNHLTTSLYFVNPSINPNDPDYITYYLDDSSYLFFTKDYVSTGNIFFQDFQITTDESIIPVTMEKVDRGGIVSQPIVDLSHPIDSDSTNFNYARFMFMKSRVSRIFSRSFLKLDQVFGLIGGLFGTVSLFLLFVGSYNNFAYEISLGSTLFKPQNPKALKKFTSYNFFSYLIQNIHGIISFIGFSPNWKSTIEYNKCQAEMEKQLDVSYLLERVLYLQSVAATVLEDHQLKALHLNDKLSLKQARRNRRAFKLKKRVYEVRKKLQKKGSLNSSNGKFSKHPQNIHNMMDANEILVNDKFQSSNQKLHPEYESKKKKKIEQEEDEFNFSDTESENSQDVENQTEEKQILKDLIQLKDQASCGIKMSERVWDITKKSIENVLPSLLFSDGKELANILHKITTIKDINQAEDSNKVGNFISNDQSDPIATEKIRPYKAQKQGERSSRNSSN